MGLADLRKLDNNHRVSANALDSVRNISLDSVDASPCAALAIGTDYVFGTLLDTHSHRRAQFLYGMTGLMEVGTEEGAWVVPPYTGVWIPALKPHRVRMN